MTTKTEDKSSEQPEELVTIRVPKSRAAALEALFSERAYQDKQLGNARRHEGQGHMTPGECLLTIEECALRARAAWYAPDGGVNVMPHLRKVAGVAFQAMERFGVPLRELVEPKAEPAGLQNGRAE